jgi:mono/diheme cytochrome c family protein
MESRRLMIYVVALLVILLVMVVYIFIQTRSMNEAVRVGDPGLADTSPDPVNGGAIYETGADLAGRMIPISGGPAGFVMEGAGCVKCHGEDGRGGKPIEGLTVTVPNIKRAVKGTITGMSREDFTRVLKWGERPNGTEISREMPRYDVPQAQIDDLMEYIKQL